MVSTNQATPRAVLTTEKAQENGEGFKCPEGCQKVLRCCDSESVYKDLPCRLASQHNACGGRGGKLVANRCDIGPSKRAVLHNSRLHGIDAANTVLAEVKHALFPSLYSKPSNLLDEMVGALPARDGDAADGWMSKRAGPVHIRRAEPSFHHVPVGEGEQHGLGLLDAWGCHAFQRADELHDAVDGYLTVLS
jgi:hypothetical protein